MPHGQLPFFSILFVWLGSLPCFDTSAAGHIPLSQWQHRFWNQSHGLSHMSVNTMVYRGISDLPQLAGPHLAARLFAVIDTGFLSDTTVITDASQLKNVAIRVDWCSRHSACEKPNKWNNKRKINTF